MFQIQIYSDSLILRCVYMFWYIGEVIINTNCVYAVINSFIMLLLMFFFFIILVFHVSSLILVEFRCAKMKFCIKAKVFLWTIYFNRTRRVTFNGRNSRNIYIFVCLLLYLQLKTDELLMNLFYYCHKYEPILMIPLNLSKEVIVF